MPKPPPEVRVEVHVARRERGCDAPFRSCNRRIRVGDPYTLLAYPPGALPFKSHQWVNLYACTACSPVPHEVTSAPQPCTVMSGDLQCELAAGHEAAGINHQYPIGLF